MKLKTLSCRDKINTLFDNRPCGVQDRLERTMGNQSELITIRTRCNSEEAAAFGQLGFGKKKSLINKFLKIQIIGSCLLLIVYYLLSGSYSRDFRGVKNDHELVYTVIFCLIAPFAFYFIFGRLELTEKNEKKKDVLKEEYSGIWEFTVCPEGLGVLFGKYQALIAWERFEQTEINEKSLFLKKDDCEHIILSRRKVIAGDYEEFVNAVCKMTRKSENIRTIEY